MTRQSTLIHAAELLEREMALFKQRATPFGFWLPDTEQYYLDMLQTARALRDMAVTTPFEPGCV